MKDDKIQCPYCGVTYPLFYKYELNHSLNMKINKGTVRQFYFDFDSCENIDATNSNDKFRATITKCPHCQKVTLCVDKITFLSNGSITVSNVNVNSQVMPRSNCKQLPEYIPQAIRNDYEESYAILQLSPKASATLARRCLQGMIRDYWGITKNRLCDEIDALKDKIPTGQWNTIDALRKIGNIGAHMEKDVNMIIDIDSDEAEKLLKFIDLLINQWYIDRHQQEELMSDIIGISKNIQQMKQGE